MKYRVIGPVNPARQDANGVYWQLYAVEYEDGSQGQLDFYHNGTEWIQANQTPTTTATATKSKINLLKNAKQTSGIISLTKNYESLETTLISLSKSSGIDLSKHTARVVVCLDHSGSMGQLYRSGAVQEALLRLFPVALQFDDDGQLDVLLFDGKYHELPSMNLSNFENYIDTYAKFKFGGTCYAPALERIIQKHFVEEPAQVPTFVIFITDGANFDRSATDEVIRRSSRLKMFIQFIGIGDEDDFDYLQGLDDLDGRQCDNTGFSRVQDLLKLPVDKLYNELLQQYIPWLRVMPTASDPAGLTSSTPAQRKKLWGIF